MYRDSAKHAVASVIGFLKGKRAIAIARLGGKGRSSSGEHFAGRGYVVSAVGFALEQIRQYIREQEAAGGQQRAILKLRLQFISLFRGEANSG